MKQVLIALVILAAIAVAFFGLDRTKGDAAAPTDMTASETAPATEATSDASAETTAEEPAASDNATDAPASSSDNPADRFIPVTYGDPNAPILIEEYASYTCSHCGHFYKDTFPKLKEKYIDSGKAQMKLYSFVRNEPDLMASLLVQCLEDNDTRQRFVRALFNAQDSWAYSSDYVGALKTLAKVGGVAEDKFDACLRDKSAEEAILAVRQYAAETRKITSTPFFFVNGSPLKGAIEIESFDALIAGEKAAETGAE
jgi:protein-disulfide isomerase